MNVNNDRKATADVAREMLLKVAVERLEVAVNWQELFMEFCRQHGGDPVFHDGRLLFQDGWTHSADNHRGPSWPPSTEPIELDCVNGPGHESLEAERRNMNSANKKARPRASQKRIKVAPRTTPNWHHPKRENAPQGVDDAHHSKMPELRKNGQRS
jgi:hypothetical protein